MKNYRAGNPRVRVDSRNGRVTVAGLNWKTLSMLLGAAREKVSLNYAHYTNQLLVIRRELELLQKTPPTDLRLIADAQKNQDRLEKNLLYLKQLNLLIQQLEDAKIAGLKADLAKRSH